MATDTPRSSRSVRLALVTLVLALVASACGGGGEPEATDCGQDNQTGPRREWSDEASRCFRQLYQDDATAFARVVETREGVGLATVEYESDGSNTFTVRTIRSGGVTTVAECTRLGASRIDDIFQLDPLECEALQ